MSEIWELVNEKKEKTGILHERQYSELIPKGLYHIVVAIFTVTAEGEVLLTQRSPEKPMGLLWECTMGSVLAGEESLPAAVRELHEETGISAPQDALIYLGDTYRTNWIVDSYLYIPKEKPTLSLQKEEVADARFVPIDDVKLYHTEIVDGVWKNFCKYRKKIDSLLKKSVDNSLLYKI